MILRPQNPTSAQPAIPGLGAQFGAGFLKPEMGLNSLRKPGTCHLKSSQNAMKSARNCHENRWEMPWNPHEISWRGSWEPHEFFCLNDHHSPTDRPLPGTSSVITLLVEVKQSQGYTHLFSAIYFGPYFTPKGPKLYLNFPKNQRFISYIDDTWSDVIWTNLQVGNGSWMEDEFFSFSKGWFSGEACQTLGG